MATLNPNMKEHNLKTLSTLFVISWTFFSHTLQASQPISFYPWTHKNATNPTCKKVRKSIGVMIKSQPKVMYFARYTPEQNKPDSLIRLNISNPKRLWHNLKSFITTGSDRDIIYFVEEVLNQNKTVINDFQSEENYEIAKLISVIYKLTIRGYSYLSDHNTQYIYSRGYKGEKSGED